MLLEVVQMKDDSTVRAYYHSYVFHWPGSLTWEELSEETKQLWRDNYNRRQEVKTKEN